MAQDNGFSESEKAFIREVAFAVLKEGLGPTLALHTAECPHGKAVTRWRYVALGLVIGAAIFGVSGGLSAAALILKAMGG